MATSLKSWHSRGTLPSTANEKIINEHTEEYMRIEYMVADLCDKSYEPYREIEIRKSYRNTT